MSTTTTNTALSSDGNQLSRWQRVQRLLNIINHLLISLTAAYIIVLAKSLGFQDTALHAFLTMIGFHVLAAEALMSHYPINSLTKRLSYRNKSRLHGALQLVGGTLALWGALWKIQQTEEHFNTWHGKIGLAATFMCGASMLGGIINFFQPKLAHRVYTPAELKYRHNLFGMFTFLLAMSAIFLGYRTPFFIKYVDTEFIRMISLSTISVTTLTMIAPIRSLLEKRKYRRGRKS